MKIKSTCRATTPGAFRLASERKYLVVAGVVLITVFMAGIVVQKYKIPGETLLHVRREIDAFRENLTHARVRSQLGHLDLKIGYVNYQKLKHQRELAMTIGRSYRVHPYNEGAVGAQLEGDGMILPVNVSLKGGQSDHWEHPKKWSFKIKVKDGKTIMGMRNFSLQHPSTRHFLNEWVFHRLLHHIGLIGCRLDFVSFSINGDNLGMYLIEEHMGKELIEYNRLREGPILQFCQDINWGYSARFSSTGIPDWYYGTIIRPYDMTKTAGNETLRLQFIQAQKLLEGYRHGRLSGSEVFDISKVSRFFACIDLVGHKHAMALSNLKFYFNPVTGCIEPVGFDCEDIHGLYEDCAGCPVKGPLGIYQQLRKKGIPCVIDEKDWSDCLFSDREFFESYIHAMHMVSEPNFFKDFVAVIDSEYTAKLECIQTQFPKYRPEALEIIRENCCHLRELLEPSKCIGAWMYSIDTLRHEITLDVVNFHPLPVVMGSGYIGNRQLTCITDSVIQCQPNLHRPAESVRIRYTVPETYRFNDSSALKMKVAVRVLGTSNILFESVEPWQHTDGDTVMLPVPATLSGELIRHCIVDDDRREIHIKSGTRTIRRKMEIPHGYTVYCKGETVLDLCDSSAIVSFSPIIFIASGKKHIHVCSSDTTGRGIAILNAGSESRFTGVVFSNNGSQGRPERFLTGAVTVYNSPVVFDRCTFVGMLSEDALNIIRSKFVLRRSLFRENSFDGLDVDFCNGMISHCRFISTGNDAVDFSGSMIQMDRIMVQGAGDKGISIGERSTVDMEDVSISSTSIGVASKDLSKVSLSTGYFYDCDTGLAAYQKKKEYGGGSIHVFSVEMDSVRVKMYNDSRSVITRGTWGTQ